MVLKEINPILEQKIEYIYHSHKKPWHLNCGEIVREFKKDGKIYVDFTLSLSNAITSGRWDPTEESVVLEVIDNDDRVVFESLVPVEKSFVNGRIGIKQ